MTLERPEKRNALSVELRLEVADAFTALSADDDIGCIVLTGAGSAFCSLWLPGGTAAKLLNVS